MLVEALRTLDIDTLMAASPEELDALKNSPVTREIEHAHGLVASAIFWGYFRREAEKRGEAFELPQVVRDNLTWEFDWSSVKYDAAAGNI